MPKQIIRKVPKGVRVVVSRNSVKGAYRIPNEVIPPQTFTVTEMRDRLSEVVVSEHPIGVTKNGHIAGVWIPASEEDNSAQEQLDAYKMLAAELSMIDAMTDVESAMEQVAEVNALRDSEGYIE